MTLTCVWLDFLLQLTVLNHCCNALQRTAINYNILLRTATQRDTMTRVRHDSWLRLNTLNITATHCNALQHTATHCNTLQRTATHCNALQHTATHCNALQRTATHCTDPPLNRGGHFVNFNRLTFLRSKINAMEGFSMRPDPGSTSKQIFVRGTCAWYKHELTSITEFYLSY